MAPLFLLGRDRDGPGAVTGVREILEIRQGSAAEAEEVVQKVSAEQKESDDDCDGGYRVSRGEPGEPNGEEIFAKA